MAAIGPIYEQRKIRIYEKETTRLVAHHLYNNRNNSCYAGI